MVSRRKKGKTINCEAREMKNHVNHQCKQEAVEKSLILPIRRSDERTVNCCGVSVATVKQIRRESRKRNYAEKNLIFLTRSICSPHNVSPHCQSQIFSPE
jgi:hypothetical protein